MSMEQCHQSTWRWALSLKKNQGPLSLGAGRGPRACRSRPFSSHPIGAGRTSWRVAAEQDREGGHADQALLDHRCLLAHRQPGINRSADTQAPPPREARQKAMQGSSKRTFRDPQGPSPAAARHLRAACNETPDHSGRSARHGLRCRDKLTWRECALGESVIGAPGGIRTHDPRFRKGFQPWLVLGSETVVSMHFSASKGLSQGDASRVIEAHSEAPGRVY